MFDITQLNCSLRMQAATETSKRGPRLEIIAPDAAPLPLAVRNPKPMVTWRVTRSCNLNCFSCLYDSRPRRYGSELTTREGMALISDLAVGKVRRLRFAGGEPLLRADLVELVAYTRERGIQPSLFTNGTLLSRARAAGLQGAGLHSVSILLEGIGREVDRHRGMRGAFDAVLEGYANCEAAGLAAEVRIPLNRWNYPELADILDFIERRQIRQAVFAHLVYTGRGNQPPGRLDPRPEAPRSRPDPRARGRLPSPRSCDQNCDRRKPCGRHLPLPAISTHESPARRRRLPVVAGLRGEPAGRGGGPCRHRFPRRRTP